LILEDDRGSATVEFTLVSILLVLLTLGVMQVALVLHVKNTVSDAASEGARWAALADSSLPAGVTRTRELIDTSVGSDYSKRVRARYVNWLGQPAVEVTVRTRLPALGLWMPALPLEVMGHAAREVVG
jgi:Flp pilus assembly protein TadG